MENTKDEVSGNQRAETQGVHSPTVKKTGFHQQQENGKQRPLEYQPWKTGLYKHYT